jgi:hypothetical protein
MTAYLMIENPGVAAPEAFTLLGASTKRNSENSNTIGKFGSGNKHGVAVLLRHKLNPIVFASNLKLEFGTRTQKMDTTDFERVVVKFGGKDKDGINRSYTEDLGFVLEYGASDWLGVDLALREFVSNSIDRAIDDGEREHLIKWLGSQGQFRGEDAQNEYFENMKDPYSHEFATCRAELIEYRKKAKDYKKVRVEVVTESQVRAKNGHTRVFVPMNSDVLEFYSNLGKWFLHFSEPELLKQTILPKANRNLEERRTAVIYRRGVRVREFLAYETPSLFDYNLEDLDLDESRKVDDWSVMASAARAISKAGPEQITRLWQSFVEKGDFWEHSFSHYGLEVGLNSPEQREVWTKTFETVAGENAVICNHGGEMAARKGYSVIQAPEAFVIAAEKAGIRTPAKVLTQDDREGREIFDPTADADAAVDFAWNLVTKYKVSNGRNRPSVKTFRKIMEAGSQTLGFYRDNVVYINQDIASNGSLSLGWHGLSQQLLVTALEEVAHHVTGATDNSRDFQDFMLNLIVYMAKEMAGVE